MIGFPGHGHSLGWLALGDRLSGEQYSPSDLTFLENLASQASVAIQRVQIVANMERRIQEMNALTRVSQGVNITLAFDDVLELIYAQTTQILPATHFYITLHNKEHDYYFLGFAVENNERITERENQALAVDVDLARETMQRGRPFLTQDYKSDCRAQRVTPIASEITAWMGVPLNTGGESIGVLSVGNRDLDTKYTSGHMGLLEAIANQTAGAIVKTCLLRETQQRASQLSRLNEVTRQLTATLELEPLLHSIVEGAASILDCEAGFIYLVDPATNELILRATSRSINKDLVGKRIRPGDGTAGRAAEARTLIFSRESQNAAASQIPPAEGMQPVANRGMAVPLQVKDTLLGVLELMNRNNGSPFTAEDQTLLTAFSGQAAIALQNVRSHMLTDQELAARVEELSVMQRIDRELNASLETDRAMHITLEWAMRQANADAGLIGMLKEGKLDIVAEVGFDQNLGMSTEQVVDLTLSGFQAAIDSGLPQRVRLQADGIAGLLPSSDHQVVVPIRRETSVIGLLVLESVSSAQEDLGFLSRLSDHAAIAISNAQLYAEVQRANVAKSDFVSLVAHELKNPMTSIKGYTELLAAGAVGAVNEMQANFLNTIRSNTERMSTLVSDLNDNSKIEAGRLRLDFKPVILTDVVDEVVRSTKHQMEEKKQTITVELPPGLPKVWGDQTRLGQVFTNLVSNANKYTPEGGSLFVGAAPSTNQWDPTGVKDVVHIWVRDNGIGISPEDQQRIFQKFFRSEDPKARETPGAGLGLNITRSLVEMQGGRIWFESQYGQGTTFHFTIPVSEIQA